MAKKKEQIQEKKLKVTLVKSSIGFAQNQKDTVRSLGLRRINHTVTLTDNPQIRGMIYKVRHLLTVEEIE
ncbi:MAG: 50S ribosomal protein L30 [Chloroflexota bacterium]